MVFNFAHNKKIIDVGAGIGRLSLPLSKYAKNIISLDSNNKLKNYYKDIKNLKLKFICNNAEKYLKNKTADIFIFAWPPLEKKLVNTIKKSMHKESKLIVFIPKDNSEYESLVNKIGIINKSESKIYNQNKKHFSNFLEQEFKVIKKQLLKTKYTYKNKIHAFDSIKENIEFWYNIKLTSEQTKKLNDLINKHKESKPIFNELVYFYILKNKL